MVKGQPLLEIFATGCGENRGLHVEVDDTGQLLGRLPELPSHVGIAGFGGRLDL